MGKWRFRSLLLAIVAVAAIEVVVLALLCISMVSGHHWMAQTRRVMLLSSILLQLLLLILQLLQRYHPLFFLMVHRSFGACGGQQGGRRHRDGQIVGVTARAMRVEQGSGFLAASATQSFTSLSIGRILALETVLLFVHCHLGLPLDIIVEMWRLLLNVIIVGYHLHVV